MAAFSENDIIHDGKENLECCPQCGMGGCLMDVKDAFQYGGKHFESVGRFNKFRASFGAIEAKLRTDPELGFCVKGYAYKSKYPYSHEGFYAAATVKNCDVFRCLENNNLYVPCLNDIQLYSGSYTEV